MEYTENATLALHNALIFAARAHHGQMRKGTDIPYIVHPFEVAQILSESGCGNTVIIAALLHDTLEDTNVTKEEILRLFGGEVLRLVTACSEDKSKSWEARKQQTIDELRERADYETLLVAGADKLSNLRSMKVDLDEIGNELWKRFNRGRAQQSWYYGELLDALSPLADHEFYQEFTELYGQVFGGAE